MDYVRRDAGGTEFTAMLDALSTNLTHFFRESSHFEYLAREFLPSIVAAAPRRGRRLRVWSAGCSSGEEPYSVAITLREHLPRPEGLDVRVLASDISTRMLATAREGVYPAERLQDVPGSVRSRYFECLAARPVRRYRVAEPLRRMITFARINLMEPWPMSGPFDVIFCRNVMIYFDKPTQERLIHRYWDVLTGGGVLFLGHSESLAGVAHRFRYVRPTVYRKA